MIMLYLINYSRFNAAVFLIIRQISFWQQ